MNPTIHILTVCQRGNTRSVCLARILKDERNYRNVLACGIETVDTDTFKMLHDWADKIFVVAEDAIFQKVPMELRDKVTHVDVGIDHWGDPYVPELMQLMREKANDLRL